MTDILPLIWFIIIAAELALYVVLDGANLGIGILSLLPQKEENRSLFLHTLGPTWNANETWLLVAAGSLFGAFPFVFATALNALYIPGVVLLVGIIIRAVSFEFYDYADRKWIWSKAFGFGSLILAIGQGLVLGGLLGGIPIANGHFSGTPWSWATPFTFLFVLGVLSAYVVLGDSALVRRSGEAFQHEPFRRVLALIFVTFFSFVSAVFFLPHATFELFMARWATYPTDLILAIITAAAIVAMAFLVVQTFNRSRVRSLYWIVLSILALGFVGVFVGIFPYIVPPSTPYWAVASPDSTLGFMLMGIGPILPIILAYNVYLAYIFRSKPDAPARSSMYDGY